MKRLFFLIALIGLSGCFKTSIGSWNETKYRETDFGQWRKVHVCVYLDEGVTRERAEYLLGDWSQNLAKLYRIDPVFEGFETLPRQGFLHNAVLNEVKDIPLKGDCDRVFYFANRGAGDYAYGWLPFLAGVPLPVVMGEVDDPTMTHGFAAAYAASPAAMFYTPRAATSHELYHLLGSCPHAQTLDECYERISRLKHTEGDDGFYPSLDASGAQVFMSRHQVNERLASWSDSFWP